MNPDYIVSLAGPVELHERAKQYNNRRSLLSAAKDDLDRAMRWNQRERFGSGWFSQTKPPVETAELYRCVASLEAELISERAEIYRLSEGSLK